MNRPNILLIYTDQQRWDALGANGNSEIITPNLDRLAAEGNNYDHFFVNNPVCMPSRVSMLTGRYPSSLGIFTNGVPVEPDELTLPRMLSNYGYHSANFGKLHFLPHANRDHHDVHSDYGFDQLEISDEPGCYEDAYRAWVRARAPEQLDKISCGLPPAALAWRAAMNMKETVKHPEERFPKRPIPFEADDDLTFSAFVADRTIDYLHSRQASGSPFFCIAGFYSPHSPWIAPQKFLDLYNPADFKLPTFPDEMNARRGPGSCDDEELRAARHGYYAMVTELDHYVGRILEALSETGLADNTIVIFTSDHGEFLGDQLMYGKGYPAPDCISRVPLIVRRPGAAGGQTLSQLTEAVDLAPSILRWAGVQAPGHLQGEAIAETPDQPGKEAALTEGVGWKALRTATHRYIAEADGSEKLIDLAADPGEYHNVAGRVEYDEALADARAAMIRKLLEIERARPRQWTY